MFHLKYFLANVESNGQVQIHFDGWDLSYDYSTDLRNEDLFPCGFHEYIKERDRSFYYKGLESSEKPKSSIFVFIN